MKLYENGTIYKGDMLIGRHHEQIDDLICTSDDRGTYACFPDNQLPQTATLFADAEKQADFLLKQMFKVSDDFLSPFRMGQIFGQHVAQHMYDTFYYRYSESVPKFYRSLDAENSKLFIAAIVRL
jgi:hypothetical protein